MKFEVTRTSDWDYKEEIEIDTLEQLMNFCKENGQIVLTPSAPVVRKYLPSIEIYDTWRE